MNAPHGAGGWLADPTAQLLLESRIPARVAWSGPDGAPRIAPMWFAWDGAHFVLLDDVGEMPGLVPEYRAATVRYLGPDTAHRWFDHLGASCRQVRLSVLPQAVTVADLARDSTFLTPPQRPPGAAARSNQE